MAPANVPERYRPFLANPLGGDSVVIDPRGEILAGPASGETMIVADCPLVALRMAKVGFDCTGHSARGDQLKFWNQALGAPDEQGPEETGFEQDGGPDESAAPAERPSDRQR